MAARKPKADPPDRAPVVYQGPMGALHQAHEAFSDKALCAMALFGFLGSIEYALIIAGLYVLLLTVIVICSTFGPISQRARPVLSDEVKQLARAGQPLEAVRRLAVGGISLSDALLAVQAFIDEQVGDPNPTLRPLPAAVRQLIDSGQPLAAVRLLHEETGMDLASAMTTVESYLVTQVRPAP